MSDAKQMQFCGAVARALLIGVDKTCDGHSGLHTRKNFPKTLARRTEIMIQYLQHTRRTACSPRVGNVHNGRVFCYAKFPWGPYEAAI